MKDQVLGIIRDVKSDNSINEDSHLVFDGILSSLDILQLIQTMQETFGVTVPVEEVLPDNFDSVDGIVAMIERLTNG